MSSAAPSGSGILRQEILGFGEGVVAMGQGCLGRVEAGACRDRVVDVGYDGEIFLQSRLLPGLVAGIEQQLAIQQTPLGGQP